MNSDIKVASNRDPDATLRVKRNYFLFFVYCKTFLYKFYAVLCAAYHVEKHEFHVHLKANVLMKGAIVIPKGTKRCLRLCEEPTRASYHRRILRSDIET